MPRLFSRLPVSLHKPSAAALVVLTALCAIAGIALFVVFSQTTETTGHLWWKETREISYSERRPYLLASIGFAAATALLLSGAVELLAALATQRRADRRLRREAADEQRRWEMSPAGQAQRNAWAAEAHRRREIELAARAEREAAEARRRWEMSTAGQAALAFHRGDHYFSIELMVDGDLAQQLNAVSMAGWRQESVGIRHEKTTSQRPLPDGTHEVTREIIEYRTYLFRRNH